MFVKYDCGCIGIPMTDSEAIIISACDEDRDTPRESLSWATRSMPDKTYEPFDPRAETNLHARLAKRLNLADRFDTLRGALGII
jgi:hypothetical protein